MGEKFQNKLSDQQMMLRKTPREDDKFGIRGVYSRDLTAIIHSRAFQRLKHKTQLFFHPQNDHICTRMEHSLYVASIANTVCENLGLNGTLAQAMAMGHDLGHPPFGHEGEIIIQKLFNDLGDFKHAKHSIRVVDQIEFYGRGINLTYAVRNGIIAHSGESDIRLFKIPENIEEEFLKETISDKTLTWEACVVKVCDRIAFIGRDLEDAILSGVIEEKEIPDEFRNSLGHKNGEIIDRLVRDVIDNSLKEGQIGYSEDIHRFLTNLYRFEIENIYNSELKQRWRKYVECVLSTLKDFYSTIINKYQADTEAYKRNESEVVRAFGKYISMLQTQYLRDGMLIRPQQIIMDYIVGMSDRFALDTMDRILHMGISGFGRVVF
ncbi:MAG: HD domain-containing protein [Caldisericia bacterium]|nr:HD domain-containing protein [Caldisericia bacterium]